MKKITPDEMREYLKNEWRLHRKGLYRRFVDQPEHLAIGNAIILHGYRGNIRAPHFKDLTNTLDDAGFHIATCDLPGFGKSKPFVPGMEGQILSFAILVRLAKMMLFHMLLSSEKSDKPVILIGYSLGALVIVRLLQIYPNLQRYIDGIVLISLPLRVDHNARKELRRFKVILKPLFGVIAKVFSRWSVSSYEPDEFSEFDPRHYKGDMNAWTAYQIMNAAEKARSTRMKRIRIPVVFVHGEDDPTALLKDVEWAYGEIGTPSDKKTKLIYKTDHLLLQRERRSITDIAQWSVMTAKCASPHNQVYHNVGLLEKSIRGLFEILFSTVRQLWRLIWTDIIEEGFRRTRATVNIWFRKTR